MNNILIISLLLLLSSNESKAQIKGEQPGDITDSTFIFDSPRPLITSVDIKDQFSGAWGFDLLFSGHGFGGGFFYERTINEKISVFASLNISGARNSDEFESQWDPQRQTYVVPDKVNRLYMFPLIFGGHYYVFTEEIASSLRPYISAGLGPTFILSTPYEKEFFEAFGYAAGYTRFGSFIGIGADVGGQGNSMMSVNIKYYYIPFGGEGLESIKDLPIKNFGGIFLSLDVGMKF